MTIKLTRMNDHRLVSLKTSRASINSGAIKEKILQEGSTVFATKLRSNTPMIRTTGPMLGCKTDPDVAASARDQAEWQCSDPCGNDSNAWEISGRFNRPTITSRDLML